MTQAVPVTFLLDVDDTLHDTDRFIADLHAHLTQTIGADGTEQYWAILEALRVELGYVDYLGALQHYRRHNPLDQRCLKTSAFLLDYPFATRLYPGALEVIAHLSEWGPVVILSDGDAVYQPHKLEQSGLFKALNGRVLIFIHKEQALPDVESQYPAGHYVMVDDKLRILTSIKKQWGGRVTTVFARQGHYAHDPQVLAECPPADIAIDHIADLRRFDLPALLAAGKTKT